MKKDERLKELIAALKPRLREMVEEIIAEKLRADPRVLDGIDAAPVTAGRRSFLRRMVSK